MPQLLQIFLLSMTPFGELRLSIPVGVAAFNMDAVLVFLVSVAGNLVPAILILLFFEKVMPYFFARIKPLKKLFDWWRLGASARHSPKIEKYGIIGLFMIVAIPLPLTGAYTGSLLASLMGLPFKKSLLAIVAGVAVAGLIVTGLVLFGINFFI